MVIIGPGQEESARAWKKRLKKERKEMRKRTHSRWVKKTLEY